MSTKTLPTNFKSSCLSDYIFVITGTTDYGTRPVWKKLIEDCGGKVLGTLSKSTKYRKVTTLLYGSSDCGAKKIEVADSDGIRKISEIELIDLIEHNSDPSLPRIEPTLSHSYKRKLQEKEQASAQKRLKKGVKDVKPILKKDCQDGTRKVKNPKKVTYQDEINESINESNEIPISCLNLGRPSFN